MTKKLSRGKDLAKILVRRSDTSTILATFVLLIIFTATNSSFLSPLNIFNVSRTASLYFFVGLGQVFCQIQGGINLSLAGTGTLSVVCFGIMVQEMGIDPIVACVATLGVGLLCGLLNGVIITKLNLPAFVVTLSTGFIYDGLVTGFSKGVSYTEIPESFCWLGRGSVGCIPYLAFLMLGATAVLLYVFKYTVIGRHILATGSNEAAARLSGIKTTRIVMLCNILSGMFASVSALLWISRLGNASCTLGSDWQMISFAGAILGGTGAGRFSPIGLTFAAVLYTMIMNGLVMANVNVYYQNCFLGAIILFSICFESFRSNFVTRHRI